MSTRGQCYERTSPEARFLEASLPRPKANNHPLGENSPNPVTLICAYIIGCYAIQARLQNRFYLLTPFSSSRTLSRRTQ
jgi:hypothetical protein